MPLSLVDASAPLDPSRPLPPSGPSAEPGVPAQPRPGRADRGRGGPGLSPSRANDFLQCPLLFRFRVIDKLTEPPSEAAARGTLVHSVLERLYDAPAAARTVEAAVALLPAEWDRLRETEPRYAELFPQDDGPDGTSPAGNPGAAAAVWLASAKALIGTYFTLEDPTRLEPRERELFVETELDGGPLLRGVVDRLDVAPGGEVRVVDYKTGRSPRAAYEGSALFQMRFYALVLWRLRGEIPRMLQLVYLGDGKVLRHVPEEAELAAVETKIRAVWAGIEDAARSGDWKPRKSALCPWCAHQDLCPAFGGTPPEVPAGAVELAVGVRPEQARTE